MQSFDISMILKFLDNENIEYSIDNNDLFNASLDHMRYSFLPECVVFATSTSDVSRVLKQANIEKIPVTVRGAGTGCAGGSVPICGGIVLDLSRIDFIQIDEISRIAHVGAGAVTSNINEQANKFNLFYPPDPSSHKFSSIGGNIACNAGGLRAFKYGTTRDYVVSLEVVLPNGDVINTALPLKKYSVGLNLRDFFIGSEGTLGVVTKAYLKLLPRPTDRLSALAFFKNDKDAFEGIFEIMKSNLSPSVLEFMDSQTVACVKARHPNMIIKTGVSAILAEFDNDTQTKLQQVEAFSKLLSNNALVEVAKDEQTSEDLWKIRRYCSQSMYELGDSKISQDIVLPYNAIVQYFEFFRQLGVETNLATPVFGHAGDGNYHIHFMYNGTSQLNRDMALDAMDKAINKAIQLGGAVSGEHGIGFLKSKYMKLQHSHIELELMKSVKKLFDPNDILNRSKVLVETSTKNLYPLKKTTLPWD